MGSPDDGKSSEPFVLTELLGRAHINKLQIPIVLDHDVLRLEVTVDYIDVSRYSIQMSRELM